MALCFVCFEDPGAFQSKYVLACEVKRATDQGFVPSKWKKSPKSPKEWTVQDDWRANVTEHGGRNWFICENCYREVRSHSSAPAQTPISAQTCVKKPWWKFW